MIIAFATITFDSAREAEMVTEASRAQSIFSSDPSCLKYVFDPLIPGSSVMTSTEIWADLNSFEDHVWFVNNDDALSTWRSLVADVQAQIYDAHAIDLPNRK